MKCIDVLLNVLRIVSIYLKFIIWCLFDYYGRYYCPFPSLDVVSNFIPSEKKARLHVYRAQTVGHLTTNPVSSSDTTGDVINTQLTP